MQELEDACKNLVCTYCSVWAQSLPFPSWMSCKVHARAAQTMENSLSFFPSNTVTGCTNHLEHITYPNDDLDQLMFSSYDHNLVDFMLFEGCKLIDTDELHAVRGEVLQPDQQNIVNGDSHVDAPRSSHGHNLHVEDEALLRVCALEEHDIDDGDSSPTIARTRKDRSKTLVAERKRRVRMKEKLYELRSLVPNITKMDKASIIADAVVYVKNLQSQSRKLMDEIRMLEYSSTGNQVVQISNQYAENISNSGNTRTLTGNKIVQVNAQGLGEGMFYVRVVGDMGDGVASALYSAIDSLSGLHLESSNFLLGLEEFTLSLIFKAGGFRGEINASCIKMWVMSALSKEGFLFQKTTCGLCK